MGMPALKKAAAQERRVDIGEVIGKKYRELRNDVADSFGAVRAVFKSRIKKRMSARVTPLAKDDIPVIEGLIKTIEKINREWSVYNNGMPVIDMKGETTKEKFKSLTTDVLGKSGIRATFLDPAAAEELETKISQKLAEGHANVHEAQAQKDRRFVAKAPELPKVVPRPLPTERPEVTKKPPEEVVKPKPVVTEKPPEEVPVPKPVTGLSPELDAYCEQVLADLKKMEDYHSKNTVKEWAKKSRPLLEKEHEKIKDGYSPKQQKRLEDVIKMLTSGELYKPGDKYNTLLLEAEKSMFETVAAAETKGEMHKLFGTLQEVHKTVQDTKGDNRQSAKYVLSDRIIYNLANLWRLDEGQKLKMTKLLVEAAVELGVGTEAQKAKWLGVPGLKVTASKFTSRGEAGARERIQESNKIYTAAQTAMMEDLRVIRAAADAVADEIDGSKIPTRKELRAAPRRYGQTAYMTTKVGHNGKENLMKKFLDASKEADRMLRQEQGRLSSRLVNGLYESVSANAAAVRALISLWGVANSPAVKSRLAKDRTSLGILWRNLGIATMAIIDGNFNPYTYYSPSERKMMLGMHTYVGDVELPAGKRATEKRLVNMLKTSREWKYDDVIWGVYKTLVKFAPKPSGVSEETIDKLAKLTVLQPYCERTYENYLKKKVGLKEKEKHLQSPKRLETVRNLLIEYRGILGFPQTRAVWEAKKFAEEEADTKVTGKEGQEIAKNLVGAVESTSEKEVKNKPAYKEAIRLLQAGNLRAGLKELSKVVNVGDSLYDASEKWLTHAAGKIDAKDIPLASDTLYQMLMNLTAIRKAEVWLANKALQPSSLSEETRKEAKAAIEKAKMVYTWLFSGGPERPSVIYPLLPASLARSAVELLAPAAMDVTEGQGRFAFLTPLQISIIKGKKVQEEERVPMAAEIETKHLNLVISQKDNVSFSGSAVDDLLKREGYLAAYRMLNPIVGRVNLLRGVWKPGMERRIAMDAVGEVKARRLFTKARIDTYIDQEANTHESRGYYPAGHLFVEVRRQDMLNHDTNMPEILRNLKVEDFIGGMETIAEGWGAKDPKKQLEGSNTILLKLLKARLDEVESRLKSRREKDKALIGLLSEQSKENMKKYPKAYYVKTAKEELERLKKDYETMKAGEDLFTGRGVNVRHRIAIAEMLLASLSDENIKDIPKVERYITYRLAREAPIEEFKEEGVDYVQATAEPFVELPEGGTETFSAYQEKHGLQNVSFYWIFYRREKGDYYVVNPLWDRKGGRLQPEYIGKVMRNVPLPDGTMGDVVVKVKQLGGEWKSVKDDKGNDEILYHLEKDPSGEPTLKPILKDIQDTEKLREICNETSVPFKRRPISGEPSAIVILNPDVG